MVKVDAVLVVLIVVLVAGYLVARHLYRFSRRQLASAAAQTVDLRARMHPPGPKREAAMLRTRLDAEVRATREMLRTAPRGLLFRADAASLVADLDATAASLIGELAAIERFRDPAQQRAALAAVGPQAEELIDTTYRARQTLLQTTAEDRAGDLSRLRARVEQQAAALDVYRRDDGQLSI